MDNKQTGNPPRPRPHRNLYIDQSTRVVVVVVVVVVLGFQFVYYPFNYLIFSCASILWFDLVGVKT